MIICQCAGVTDTTIRRLIEEGVGTLSQIIRLTGAGRCCAPCRSEIRTILYRHADAPHTAGQATHPTTDVS
jgi:bacterioferritin-associated ferredoxin